MAALLVVGGLLVTRGPQPGHVVYSGGKPYYVSANGYVPHDPAKYQAKRERSRWAGARRADDRVQVL